jgi:RimJ/RimL family protein N-acetyltransferase
MGDADALLELRNEPTTRRWSLDGSRIPRSHHVAWLERRLASPEACRIWVAEVEGDPGSGWRVVGQSRIDVLGHGTGEISVGLAPNARGRGLGGWLIRAATGRGMAELGLREVVAVIKPDNAASVRAFERAGYGDARTIERLGARVLALTYPSAPGERSALLGFGRSRGGRASAGDDPEV